MLAYIIFFLLFFLPLIVLPTGISPFESSKVIVAEIVIELLALIYFYTHRKQVFKVLSTYLGKLIVLFFILTLIQLPFQISNNTFFGNAFRLQGVFLLWHLIIFAVISANIKLDNIPKLLNLVPLPALLLGIFLFGLNPAGRSVGTLGEPNALAAVAVFLFPFAFFASQKVLLKILVIFLTIVIIFLSGSGSGWLALCLQVILLFLTQRFKLTLAKVLIACIFLLSFSLYLPFLEGGGWYENRAEVWQTAFYAGLQSPFLGHGFGNITDVLQDASKSLNNNIQYQFVDSSHNLILDLWVQGGLAAVSLILLIIIYVFYRFVSRKRIVEMTAFLGIIAVMLFNPASVAILIAFWWLIGWGFSTT